MVQRYNFLLRDYYFVSTKRFKSPSEICKVGIFYSKNVYICRLFRNEYCMKKKVSQTPSQRPVSKRTHKVAFLMNDDEQKILDKYVSKYKVENVSKFVREAVIRTALRQLDEDRPTLFDQK